MREIGREVARPQGELCRVVVALLKWMLAQASILLSTSRRHHSLNYCQLTAVAVRSPERGFAAGK